MVQGYKSTCVSVLVVTIISGSVDLLWDLEFRVQGSGFRVQGLGFEVWGSGLRV